MASCTEPVDLTVKAVDLREFLASPRQSVMITVVSVRTDFPVPFDTRSFDRFVRTNGATMVIRVPCIDTSRAIGEILSDVTPAQVELNGQVPPV